MPRWLLPLLAVFALLGNAVTAYAAAGVIGEAACCCPVKKTCKCHDHDGEPRPATLKRCGGEAKLVAPAVAVAIAADKVEIIRESRVTVMPALAPLPLSQGPTSEPEKPPI